MALKVWGSEVGVTVLMFPSASMKVMDVTWKDHDIIQLQLQSQSNNDNEMTNKQTEKQTNKVSV
jgi:hypothetical protein